MISITAISIAPSTIITTVPVAVIGAWSVIRIPIPIGRSGVTIYRSGVSIVGWWSIIPIPWAAADGTYNCSCCP
jgi:hypothetical protein